VEQLPIKGVLPRSLSKIHCLRLIMDHNRSHCLNIAGSSRSTIKINIFQLQLHLPVGLHETGGAESENDTGHLKRRMRDVVEIPDVFCRM
jgi:hypothetical protein